MTSNKSIYFASDFHLGLQVADPGAREQRVVSWLQEIREDAAEVFLLGDVFDFWWEYKRVVPRGHVRFLAAVASLTDAGIPVHFFTGNHDMWTHGYLEEECGLQVHYRPEVFQRQGKTLHLAHGEGLGPGQKGYKALLWAFRNPVIQWIYSRFHPNFGVALGMAWSQKSRLGKGLYLDFQGEEGEYLIQYARQQLESKPETDYFLFGHRHLALDYPLNENCRALFLGEWIKANTYVRLKDGKAELLTFKG